MVWISPKDSFGENRTFWGDKIYFVKELNEYMLKQQGSEMLTPVKAVKGMPDVIKQRSKAADDLFSTAVSSEDPKDSFGESLWIKLGNQLKQYSIG